MKHLKKNILTLAFLFVIAGTLFSTTKADAATNKNCFTSNSLKYQITGKNTVSVKGLSNKGSKVKNLSIPKTVNCNGKTYKVTSISNNAFSNNDSLNSVKLPSSINKVGANAFKNCDKLNNVLASTQIPNLGSNCFGNAKFKLAK